MLPKSAVISSFLAREYNQLLSGSTLVRSEYHRQSKVFRFLFRSEHQYHVCYSFAPPTFVLYPGWPDKSESKSANIAVWLEANDSVVQQVTGPIDNRIINIQLLKSARSGSERHLRIVFELFGAQSTALLVDENGIILQATRVSSDERVLKPKKIYVEPEPFPQILESGKEVIGNDGEMTYTLEYNERSFRVTPSPPAEALDMEYPLSSLHAYLQRKSKSSDDFAQLKAKTLGILRREITRKKKTLAKSQSKLQLAEEAERYKRWGDILMAGQNAEPVDNKVMLHDFYSDEEIEIPLPDGKGIIESASFYYKKAKKLQRSKPPLQKAIEELNTAIAELEEQHAAVAEANDSVQLRSLIEEFRLSAGAGVIGRSSAEMESSPYYRVFLSSTGARILVGKSAVGNAHLTFKVARSYDLWFHAQQSPGSHVVLMRLDKNREPAAVAIREAAQLAAVYSGQKKSQAVSVIYTERRYVRKVRKGAPGQVIPQNVKSLVVEPGMPPGVNEAG